jgi:hypothetical protein
MKRADFQRLMTDSRPPICGLCFKTNRLIPELLKDFKKIIEEESKYKRLNILADIYHNSGKLSENQIQFLVSETNNYNINDLKEFKQCADHVYNQTNCKCASGDKCVLTFNSFMDIVFRRIFAKVSDVIIKAQRHQNNKSQDSYGLYGDSAYNSSAHGGSAYGGSANGGAANGGDSFFTCGSPMVLE